MSAGREEPFPPNYNPIQYDAGGNYVGINRQSFWEKCKEEPLVPIGAIATVTALTLGIRAFQRGDQMQSQRMMRYRVGAQGATLLFFVYYTFYKNPR